MWRRFFAIFGSVLISSASAQVPRYHPIEYADDLLKLCNNTDNGSKAVCTGFIGGVFEVVTNNPIDGFKACIPELVTIGKAQELSVQWIGSHPERSLNAASTEIAAALANSYPCSK
jgi:hypothetical protein